jgi:hypothetical protein
VTEYAPVAIQGLFNSIHAAIPQALMGGILGDAAHTYGYHRGRNYVPSSDYSVQLAEDRAGDGEAASALDLSWSDASWQYTVSQRLLAAKNDSRMSACREFYGSTDGRTVCGWDYYGGYAVTSDDSHLWHIHLSILRKHATDAAALDGIAQVITGGGSPPPSGGDWFDMATTEDLKTAVRSVLNEGTASGQKNWAGTNQAILGTAQSIVNQNNALKGQVSAMQNMLMFGDGKDVAPGSDTHPWNLKVVRQYCLDILAAIDALEVPGGGSGDGSHSHNN